MSLVSVSISAAIGALCSVGLDTYLNGFNGIGHALEVAVVGAAMGALASFIAAGSITLLVAAGMEVAEASLFIAILSAPINVAFAADSATKMSNTERGRNAGTALMVLALIAPFLKYKAFKASLPFMPSHQAAVVSETQTVKNTFTAWRYSQYPNDRRLNAGGVQEGTHWSLIPPWQAKNSNTVWRRLDLPGDNSELPHKYVYRRVFKKGEIIQAGTVPKGKFRAGHGGIDTELVNTNPVQDWEYWGTIPD